MFSKLPRYGCDRDQHTVLNANVNNHGAAMIVFHFNPPDFAAPLHPMDRRRYQ